MHATAILQTIRQRGGQVTLEDDHIRVCKTSGVLTDELRQAIRAEKAAILTILAADNSAPGCPSKAMIWSPSRCGARSSKKPSGSSPTGCPWMPTWPTARSTRTMKSAC
jgi:hypothetical protein